MAMPKINNWSVVLGSGSPYRAPEPRGVRIQGKVIGHKSFENNASIITSNVTKVKNRVIYTISGNKYLLGTINVKYRRWLHKHRPNWNWRNPLY